MRLNSGVVNFYGAYRELDFRAAFFNRTAVSAGGGQRRTTHDRDVAVILSGSLYTVDVNDQGQGGWRGQIYWTWGEHRLLYTRR